MSSLFEAAHFLEVPSRNKPLQSELQYLKYVERGLPFRSLARLAGAFAPNDATFCYRIVPKATYARCKVSGRLSKAQGERVTRLAAVWNDALSVWKTDDAVRAFLYRAHPLLDNRPPVDIALDSEPGAQLVRDILGRLEHGSAV